MVVFNKETLSGDIYEIKYNKEDIDNQSHYLNDEELNKETEHYFGTIKNKYVIYRGEAKKLTILIISMLKNISYIFTGINYLFL